MKLDHARLLPVRLVFREPFRNARGSMRERKGTLIRLRSSSGLVGWGEASRFPGFGDEQRAVSEAALRGLAEAIVGREVEDLGLLAESLSEAGRVAPCAHAAVETALLDLAAQEHGTSMAAYLARDGSLSGASIPREISCNALVTGDSAPEIERTVRRVHDSGFGVWKLKVGSLGLEADVARVAALRSIVGRAAKIRLDANQAYSEAQAYAALERFTHHDIEYIEEPLAHSTPTRSAELRRRSSIPIAADESVLSEEDARVLVDAGSADVIVIKPSAAGGPLSAMRIAGRARRAGLRVVVTSLLETVVGVSAALHTAAAIAAHGPIEACGLATNDCFERNVAPYDRVNQGVLRVSSAPGLGLEIDPAALGAVLDGPGEEWPR